MAKTFTDRITGREYRLEKRANPTGRYMDARTGDRYDLVKVYLPTER